MQQIEKIYIRNRYKIETILDSGGFGITYLAEDTEFCQKVVLKKYCPLEDRKISYEKGKKDFLREARTLSALSDITAIVRVLDYFEERGDAYIVRGLGRAERSNLHGKGLQLFAYEQRCRS